MSIVCVRELLFIGYHMLINARRNSLKVQRRHSLHHN